MSATSARFPTARTAYSFEPSALRANVEALVAVAVTLVVTPLLIYSRQGEGDELVLGAAALIAGVIVVVKLSERPAGDQLARLVLRCDAIEIARGGRTRRIPWGRVARVEHDHEKDRRCWTFVGRGGKKLTLLLDGYAPRQLDQIGGLIRDRIVHHGAEIREPDLAERFVKKLLAGVADEVIEGAIESR